MVLHKPTDARLLADQARIGSAAFVGRAFYEALEAQHRKQTLIGGDADAPSDASSFADYITAILNHGKSLFVAFAERLSTVDWQRFVATRPPQFLNELFDAATNLANATTGVDLKDAISTLTKLLSSFWDYIKSFYSDDADAQADEAVVEKESSGFMALVYARIGVGSLFGAFREQIMRYYHSVANGIRAILGAFRDAFHSAITAAAVCMGEVSAAVHAITENVSSGFATAKRTIVKAFFFVAMGCNEIIELGNMSKTAASRYLRSFLDALMGRLNNVTHYVTMLAAKLSDLVKTRLLASDTTTGKWLAWLSRTAQKPVVINTLVYCIDLMKWLSSIMMGYGECLSAVIRGLMDFSVHIINETVAPAVRAYTDMGPSPFDVTKKMTVKADMLREFAAKKELKIATRAQLRETADKAQQFMDYVQGFREKTFTASLTSKALNMWDNTKRGADLATLLFYSDEDTDALQGEVDNLFSHKYGMNIADFTRKWSSLDTVLDDDIETATQELHAYYDDKKRPEDEFMDRATRVKGYVSESTPVKYLLAPWFNTWTPEQRAMLDESIGIKTGITHVTYPDSESAVADLLIQLRAELATAKERQVESVRKVELRKIMRWSMSARTMIELSTDAVVERLEQVIKFLETVKTDNIKDKRNRVSGWLGLACLASICVGVLMYQRLREQISRGEALAKVKRATDGLEGPQKAFADSLYATYVMTGQDPSPAGFVTYMRNLMIENFNPTLYGVRSTVLEKVQYTMEAAEKWERWIVPDDADNMVYTSIQQLYIRAKTTPDTLTLVDANNLFDGLRKDFTLKTEVVRVKADVISNEHLALSLMDAWNAVYGASRNVYSRFTYRVFTFQQLWEMTNLDIFGNLDKAMVVGYTALNIAFTAVGMVSIICVFGYGIAATIIDRLMSNRVDAFQHDMGVPLALANKSMRLMAMLSPLLADMKERIVKVEDINSIGLGNVFLVLGPLLALAGGPCVWVPKLIGYAMSSSRTVVVGAYNKSGQLIAWVRQPRAQSDRLIEAARNETPVPAVVEPVISKPRPRRPLGVIDMSKPIVLKKH
jgi:hypothetical protein